MEHQAEKIDTALETITSQALTVSIRGETSSFPSPAESAGVPPRKKKRNCFRTCGDGCPRTCSICCWVILPLWLLMALAMLGGWGLARMEAPSEIETNDLIMATQYAKRVFDRDKILSEILNVPEECLVVVYATTEMGDTNFTVEQFLEQPGRVSLAFNSLESWETGMNEMLREIKASLLNCTSVMAPLLELVRGVWESLETNGVDESLTFDWIRCWNDTEVGRSHSGNFASFEGPTQKQLQAAANQSAFFAETWLNDRQRLHDMFLLDFGDNITANEELLALSWSIGNATGGGECSENLPGTAWFFFTVMTTVGYGNQGPVTGGGRAITAVFGLVAILAFAVLLSHSGTITAIIWEDFVTKCKMKVLARPLGASMFWGSVSFAWIVWIGGVAKRWWESRLGLEYSVWDSMWFSFISTTTVGLGDYYLQPEVIFEGDLFKFSFMFLVGFVFLSTFLGVFMKLFAFRSFSKGSSRLKDRLGRTNLLMRGGQEIQTSSKALGALNELLEEYEDSDNVRCRSVGVLELEAEALKKLLLINEEESRFAKQVQGKYHESSVPDGVDGSDDEAR